MRLPRHITVLPILFAMGIFGLLGIAFLVGTWVTEDRTHSRVYWFRTSDSGEIEAFLTHSLDDRFWGLRVERFPVAVVEIRSTDTRYEPPSRHGRTRTRRGIVRTQYDDSFTIRIRDGEEARADGGIWDYPPLDQREGRNFAPVPLAREMYPDLPEDLRTSVLRSLAGLPIPGDEIEAERRDALVRAVQRALREDGYGWVADGVDHDRWAREGIDFVGILKLVGGVVVLIGGAVVFERLSARWKKTRSV